MTSNVRNNFDNRSQHTQKQKSQHVSESTRRVLAIGFHVHMDILSRSVLYIPFPAIATISGRQHILSIFFYISTMGVFGHFVKTGDA